MVGCEASRGCHWGGGQASKEVKDNWVLILSERADGDAECFTGNKEFLFWLKNKCEQRESVLFLLWCERCNRAACVSEQMCSVAIVSRSELTGNSQLFFSLLLLSISPPHTQASVLCGGERSDPEFRTTEKIPTKRIKKCSLLLGLFAWFTFTSLNCLEVGNLG